MVRTSGGIRISAGKSSKKSGGEGNTRSASSTSSGKSSSKASSRLPPIPHCEAPSWQKPITNFFNVGAGSSKDKTNEEPQDLNDKEIDKENNPSDINKDEEDKQSESETKEQSKAMLDISGIEPLDEEENEGE